MSHIEIHMELKPVATGCRSQKFISQNLSGGVVIPAGNLVFIESLTVFSLLEDSRDAVQCLIFERGGSDENAIGMDSRPSFSTTELQLCRAGRGIVSHRRYLL